MSYPDFSAHLFLVLTFLFQKSCCALRAILWIEAQKKLKKDLEVTVLIGKIDNNNSSFTLSSCGKSFKIEKVITLHLKSGRFIQFYQFHIFIILTFYFEFLAPLNYVFASLEQCVAKSRRNVFDFPSSFVPPNLKILNLLYTKKMLS